MERLSDILNRIFTDAAPCTGCNRAVPTFRDRETGRAYCLPCLEAAVDEALDKKALAETLLTTGEALPFVQLLPAEEVFYIR